WLRPDGQEMTDDDWQSPETHVLGMMIGGEAVDERDERGDPTQGNTLLLLLNGGSRSAEFRPPELTPKGRWQEIVNTARIGTRPARGENVRLVAHSLLLLEHRGER